MLYGGDDVIDQLLSIRLLCDYLTPLRKIQSNQLTISLIRGLLNMYQDNDVAKYYNKSLMAGYGKRYLLFTGVIICLALAGIIVPLIIRYV